MSFNFKDRSKQISKHYISLAFQVGVDILLIFFFLVFLNDNPKPGFVETLHLFSFLNILHVLRNESFDMSPQRLLYKYTTYINDLRIC